MNTTKIVLTPEEHTELSRRVRSATISQRDGRRARVILLASQSYTRAEIARLTGLSLAVITGWCQRFQAHKHPKVKAWLEKHKRFHMHFTPTLSSWMNRVERFFRDITVYLRDGSFGSVRELQTSITTFLALRNAQPTRYVWNAKGEDILNKIQRAREAMGTQANERVGYFENSTLGNFLHSFSCCRSGSQRIALGKLGQVHQRIDTQLLQQTSLVGADGLVAQKQLFTDLLV